MGPGGLTGHDHLRGVCIKLGGKELRKARGEHQPVRMKSPWIDVCQSPRGPSLYIRRYQSLRGCFCWSEVTQSQALNLCFDSLLLLLLPLFHSLGTGKWASGRAGPTCSFVWIVRCTKVPYLK